MSTGFAIPEANFSPVKGGQEEVDEERIAEVKRRMGEAIRLARMKAGASQGDLARRMRYAQSVVSRWEAGRHLPTLDDYIRLADALEVDPVALLASALPRPDDPMKQAVEAIRKLPPQQVDAILGLLDALRV